MNKSQLSLALFAAVMAICLTGSHAAPVQIEGEERESMSAALKQGQTLFGGAIPRAVKPAPDTINLGQESPVKKQEKVHSIYTAGITSLGGGKPNRNDKHRIHQYVPLAPGVHPWSTGEKYNPAFISPEEAAQRWVPHNTYQFTTDQDTY